MMKKASTELLSQRLKMKRYRRVSPSRYTALRECLLKEVWAASGNDPLIPPSPRAELGSIAHTILEVAGRGELIGIGSDGVGKRWDAIVSDAEVRMMTSPLTRHQVPLNRSVPDYQVRKLRTCRRAIEIARDAQPTASKSHEQYSRTTGFELWVESEEGDVGGFIDRAIETSEGVVLSDYKSGTVLESEHGAHPGELKQAYRTQMLLYAALYKQMTGSWPVKLQVIPLQGEPLDVPFKAIDAENLLNEARTYIRISNERISAVQAGTLDLTELAVPDPGHCRLCQYRPACWAYWLARQRAVDGKWPTDVCGVLEEYRRLRNGKLSLRIAEASSPTSSVATVRGITDSVDRYPAMSTLSAGTQVAVYGLWRDYRSGDYTETPNTVIYRTD